MTKFVNASAPMRAGFNRYATHGPTSFGFARPVDHVKVAPSPVGAPDLEPTMFEGFYRGRYHVSLAQSDADLRACQALRATRFRVSADVGGRVGAENQGASTGPQIYGDPLDQDALDQDGFDATARHVMVRDGARGPLLACFRMTIFDGAAVAQSYSAQFYDLSRFGAHIGRAAEIGRFCMARDAVMPGALPFEAMGISEVDVLRALWAGLTRLVDSQHIETLFGCSSFQTAEIDRHITPLSYIARAQADDIFMAPDHMRPGTLAPELVPLCAVAGQMPLYARAGAEPKTGPRGKLSLPPLLRFYLSLGGWVSDHAVIDRDLDTLHVFTALNIAAIPASRVRLFRQVAA